MSSAYYFNGHTTWNHFIYTKSGVSVRMLIMLPEVVPGQSSDLVISSTSFGKKFQDSRIKMAAEKRIFLYQGRVWGGSTFSRPGKETGGDDSARRECRRRRRSMIPEAPVTSQQWRRFAPRKSITAQLRLQGWTFKYVNTSYKKHEEFTNPLQSFKCLPTVKLFVFSRVFIMNDYLISILKKDRTKNYDMFLFLLNINLRTPVR
jgi:hypothetical protein